MIVNEEDMMDAVDAWLEIKPQVERFVYSLSRPYHLGYDDIQEVVQLTAITFIKGFNPDRADTSRRWALTIAMNHTYTESQKSFRRIGGERKRFIGLDMILSFLDGRATAGLSDGDKRLVLDQMSTGDVLPDPPRPGITEGLEGIADSDAAYDTPFSPGWRAARISALLLEAAEMASRMPTYAEIADELTVLARVFGRTDAHGRFKPLSADTVIRDVAKIRALLEDIVNL